MFSSGLVEVVAALAPLRASDRPPHVTGVITSLRRALQNSARLPYTFNSFKVDANASGAPVTWESTSGRILFSLNQKHAAGQRISVEDLHSIIKQLKGLSQQFDSQEALLGAYPSVSPADLFLRVGASGGARIGAAGRGGGRHIPNAGSSAPAPSSDIDSRKLPCWSPSCSSRVFPFHMLCFVCDTRRPGSCVLPLPPARSSPQLLVRAPLLQLLMFQHPLGRP
jgi:hypothetical protein